MKKARIIVGVLLVSLVFLVSCGGVTPPEQPPWIVGSWVMDAYYYYLPGQELLAVNADGAIQMLDNYNGSGPVIDSGTWSLDGNVLTLNQFQGGLVLTITKVSDDLWSFDSEGGTRTQRAYRKGTQPGISVFDYATATALSAGAPVVGVIPGPPSPPPSLMHVHGVALYTFTAPSAGTYNVQLQDETNSSYTAKVDVSACKADKVTPLFGLHASATPVQVSLGPGDLIYLIVDGPYRDPGETFNISVQ